MPDYVINKFASTQPLIESPKDFRKQSIVSSIIGGRNVAEDIPKNILNSNKFKFHRAFGYLTKTHPWGNCVSAISPNTNGSVTDGYYGIIPVRINGENLAADSQKDTELYKANKRCLKILGTSYKDIGIAVHGDPEMEAPEDDMLYLNITSDGSTWTNKRIAKDGSYEEITANGYYAGNAINTNTNDSDHDSVVASWRKSAKSISEDHYAYDTNQGKLEDSDELDNAYVLMAVNLFDEDCVAMPEYWYRYFSHLESISEYTEFEWSLWRESKGDESKGGAIYFPEEPFNMVRMYVSAPFAFDTKLYYNYIYTETLQGNITKVGKYAIDFAGEEIYCIYQVTENNYIRKKVVGVRIEQYVADETVRSMVHTYLSSRNDPDLAGNFVLPIHKPTVDAMSSFHEIDIYNYGLHLNVNSIEKIKLKWYQDPDFLFFVSFIGFAFALATFGKSAYASQSIINALIATAANAAAGALIVEGIQLAIEAFGVEGALAVVAAIAVAAYMQNTALLGSISSGLANALPTAMDFIEFVGSVANEFTKALSELEKEKAEEYADAMKEIKAQEEELEEMFKDLEKAIEIDPMELVRASRNMFIGENVEEFYNRTIHTGNVGVLSLDTIRYYVDEKLRLPKTTDTLLGA